jgi:Tol biopolymer transport system component
MHSLRVSITPVSWAVLALSVLLACHEGVSRAGRGVTGPCSGGLVFIREVDGKADLARARIADGAVAIVSPTPDREERWPYWSDVARRVVFPARPYGPALQMDLVLWDPETGEEGVVASTVARDERWPRWSPVAPRLAYAFKQPRQRSGIAIYDLATERSEVLASIVSPGAFLRPAFSPDGRRLVAQRRAGRSRETELWLLEPGRRPRRLTSEPGAIDTKARFTNDGRTILFTRWPEGGGAGDLFRLDLETGTQRQFASLPTASDSSAWPSPTRDEIAFISDRDGSRDIFLVDLSGGVPRNLTRSPEIDEAAPLWSPDGERLVILRRQRTESGHRRSIGENRLAVIDRQGRALFETQGMMADWMPSWP